MNENTKIWTKIFLRVQQGVSKWVKIVLNAYLSVYAASMQRIIIKQTMYASFVAILILSENLSASLSKRKCINAFKMDYIKYL